MRIEHVAIANFRGIKNLDWHVGGKTICLIGPGDSTKTTILDAIELALYPSRYAPPITDSDFYGLDVNGAINIEVTLSDPPTELTAEDKYGLYLRGYLPHQPILNDPEDGLTPVLTIRFHVGSDLDPKWNIVKPSQREPKPIHEKDRTLFGMARVGEDTRRDLTWAQGSALIRITEHQRISRGSYAAATRAAAGALDPAVREPLNEAAGLAQQALTDFGVTCSDLCPRVDMHGIRVTSGVLGLHDGSVPLRVAGLGTRRLACLAIQRRCVSDKGIVLIDEVEYGLEPHRIRQLLNRVCSADEGSIGQVILTTHCPTPIYALPVESLRFVRSRGGKTKIYRAPDDIQGTVRKAGHALLAKKIIVCEGKTEEALCRALDDTWEATHNGESMAYHGVVAVNGEGRNSGPQIAVQFGHLGYDVMFFGDTDKPIAPSESELKAEGVAVVLWPGQTCSEGRITADLPTPQLEEFVNAAFEHIDEHSVVDQIGQQLDANLHSLGRGVSAWTEGYPEDKVRAAIGRAANSGRWFKNLNTGLVLGQIVAAALPDIQDTPLGQSLRKVEAWVYEQ